MTLFDTHCHLQDPAFGDTFDEVVARARATGVVGMVLCGYDAETNARTLELARRVPAVVFPTVGFHPHEAKDVTPALLDTLAAQIALDEVVGVGELGLDNYRDHSTPAQQRAALEAQLALAATAGKPVCVHSRSAEAEIFGLLAPYATRSSLGAAGRPVGVMHCFSGTLDQARAYIEIGFLISIACVITYPKNDEVRRMARELPLESLVIETDSPYLPPQRIRGQRNEPANVIAAAEAIAAARNLSLDAVTEATTANACRLFGVRVAEGALPR
jgi:TatD DNase family protein